MPPCRRAARLVRIILLLILVGTSRVAAQAPAGAVLLSPDDYASTLAGLVDATTRLEATRPQEADALLQQLPRAAWRIGTTASSLSMPTAQLRQDVETWRAHPSEATHTLLLTRLRTLHTDAEAFRRPAENIVDAHDALTTILSSPEFADVQGPTWFQRMRRQVMAWIVRFLDRLMGSSAFPTVSTILVYGLIVLGVAVLVYWGARALRQHPTADPSLGSGDAVVPVRPWRDWRAEAQRAAAAGDWREAIKAAYWSGVTYLEDQQVWRADPARTPREYVRLLSATSPHRPPVRALTDLLERTWYADEPASAGLFDEAMARLQDLGCPSS